MPIRFLALLLLAVCGTARAQSGAVGVWTAYAATARWGASPVGAAADVQLRSHSVLRDFDQAQARASVQVLLRREVTLVTGLLVGYAEEPGEPDAPVREVRPFQEGRVPQRVGRARLGHRLRVEEQFVGGQPVQVRGRYQLSANVPLRGDPERRGALSGTASVEAFLRGPGRGEQPVYDRTRLYAGLDVRGARTLVVQAGALGEVSTDGADWQLQVALRHALAF